MTVASHTAWPVKLVFSKSKQRLDVTFDDGADLTIPYQLLRRESPSAEVRGHGAGPKPPQAPIPDDIDVISANPVGRYAVQIRFSDGHDSGLYTWSLLRTLGTEQGD